MINKDNWGWRARFGIFIVSSEAVPEAEWWAILPDGISVHASRIDAPAPWATWPQDNDNELIFSDDLVRGAGHFAKMRLDAAVISHSSSSILGGPDWDVAMVRELRNHLPDIPHLTTNGLDCLSALRASSVEKPFLVFPPWFSKNLADKGARYFTRQGLEPAGTLRADAGPEWRDLSPVELYPKGLGFEQDVDYLYHQIRSAYPAQADGVLIAGTGFRCVGIIEALEKELQIPVITANQASLWHCLRMAGADDTIAGYGALLQSAEIR